MIVVCTAHDSAYAEMASITFPTVERYCAKHGYGLVYDPNVDPQLADACKIALFHKLYASGEFGGDDVFMWIDTDALVMNSAMSLTLDLGRGDAWLPAMMKQAHVLYGSDPNGLNTGVWFARFTSRADHFLRVAQTMSLAMGWSDQPGILQTYIQPVMQPWAKIIAGKGFNSMLYPLYGWDFAHGKEINDYEEGDFILHLPGIEHETRLALLREYAAKAV